MKKQTVLMFFFILAFVSQGLSQSDTLIWDNTAASWAIRIINFQQEIKQSGNPFNAIVTPQTVLEVKRNTSGELYVKITINSDRVQVLSGLVNKKNLKDYAFREKITMKSHPHRPTELSSPRYDISEYRVNNKSLGMVAEEEPEDTRLVEYQIIEKKTGKQLPSLTVEYVFPVPEPIFMSVDSQLIDNAESRIGDDIWYDTSVIRYAGLQLNEFNLGKPLKANQPLAEGLVLPADKNSLFISFKRIRSYGEATIFLEYKLDGEDKFWKSTALKETPFILLRNLPVGKHRLLVRYPFQEDKVLIYEFEIRQRWIETTFFKVFTGSVITACTCFTLFYFRNKVQRRRMAQEVLKTKLLRAEINTVRAQLNPHFIFNALSSIQGLINSGEAQRANQYLTEFSILLRDTLRQHDQSMIPLSQEINILQSYIKMEQLRFEFQYIFSMEESIPIHDIAIPSLLAQPIIENAIKHGIAGLGKEGELMVSIQKKGQALQITVADNGKGFPASWKEGYGLKLTRERIRLLNEELDSQRIALTISGREQDSNKVLLTFKNWFA